MSFFTITIQGKDKHIILDRGVTDIVKLLCCLLVASCHYAQNYILANGTYNVFLQMLASQGGYLGVAIFFFLSGFGLMSSLLMKGQTFFEFAKKRITKVYVPAVFVSILWIVCLCIFPCIPQNELGVAYNVSWDNLIIRLLGTFCFKFADSVLWFVGIIIILYLVIFLYNKLRISKYCVYKIPYLLLSTCITTTLAYFVIAPFASVSIIAFAIGVLVAEYNLSISSHLHLICATFIVICLAIGFLFRDNMILIHGLINYICLALWIWISGIFDIRISNVPKLLSNISYDIYLTHKKVLVVSTMLLPQISLTLFLLASIVVSLLEFQLRKV